MDDFKQSGRSEKCFLQGASGGGMAGMPFSDGTSLISLSGKDMKSAFRRPHTRVKTFRAPSCQTDPAEWEIADKTIRH